MLHLTGSLLLLLTAGVGILILLVCQHPYTSIINNKTQTSSGERSFRVDPDRAIFLKDGKPFNYVSGTIHYFRVPHQYWDDRLKKLRASGANAVET